MVPNYQDEVKSKINDMAGTVIAKYTMFGSQYFDIRGVDGKIYSKTKAENWTTVRTREELEGNPE